MNPAQILQRNARWAMRQRERLAKGRPPVRTTYQQFDAGRRGWVDMGVAKDPILDLYAARRARRSSPWHAQKYGEILQTVVSPGGWLP